MSQNAKIVTVARIMFEALYPYENFYNISIERNKRFMDAAAHLIQTNKFNIL